MAHHGFTEKPSLIPHTVANSDLCENILRLSRIFFQLSPDMGHIDPEDLVVAVIVRPPDLTHQIIVGQHLSRLAGEKGYQLVFDLG